MTLDRFLSPFDAERLCRILEKLVPLFPGFALTGSLALEALLVVRERTQGRRALNDVDIVVESFDSIAAAAAGRFLCRHIHPKAAAGKMVIQLGDAEEALRIDVFLPYGSTMARCRRMMFASVPMRVVSLEDLAARAAMLVLDLDRGEEVSAKHARDFERLIQVIDAHGTEAAWRDHRQPGAPAAFMDAAVRIGALIDARGELLVVPDYSHDGAAVCPTCEETGPFRLASAKAIESILGYC